MEIVESIKVNVSVGELFECPATVASISTDGLTFIVPANASKLRLEPGDTGFLTLLKDDDDQKMNLACHCTGRKADRVELVFGNVPARLKEVLNAWVDSTSSVEMFPITGFDAEQVKNLLRTRMSNFDQDRLPEWIVKTKDALLDVADKAKNNQDQRQYFEDYQKLDKDSAALLKLVAEAHLQKLEDFFQGEVFTDPLKGGSQGQSLSLVDTQEFEDVLALRAAAARIENLCSENLPTLRLRMQALIGETPAEKLSAVCPAVYVSALKNQPLLEKISRASQRIVIQSFREAIVEHYGVFLGELNQELEAQGVLQGLSLDSYRRTSSRGSTQAQKTPPKTDVVQESEVKNSEAQKPSVEVEIDSSDQRTAPASSASRKPSTMLGKMDQQRFSEALNASRDYSNQAAACYDAVKNLMRGRQQLQDSSSNVPSGLSDVEAGSVSESMSMPAEEVISQLDLRMQDLQQLNQPLDMPLREAMQDVWQKQTGESLVLPQQVEDVTETVEGLFDVLIKDQRFSESVRDAVATLQVPVARALLQDENALLEPSSPLRRIINGIGRVGLMSAGNNAVEPMLQRQAREVCESFNGDLENLEEVASEIEFLCDKQEKLRERNISRLTERYEGSAKRRRAEKHVSSAIEHRIGGREVPRLVMDLLDLGWRKSLTQSWLRSGSDSDQWHERLSVVDRLLERAAGKQVEQEPVERAVRTVFDEMLATHIYQTKLEPQIKILFSQDMPSLDLVRVPKSEEQVEDEHGLSELERRWRARARSYEIGQWFLAEDADEDKDLLLAWRDEDGGLFVFVNHRGLQVTEMDVASFAGKLSSGQMIANDEAEAPIVDQGLEKLVQDFYERLSHQAAVDELTGALKRSAFEKRLNGRFRDAPDLEGVLCLLELEQMQLLNNTHGHKVGEELVQDVADHIRHSSPDCLFMRASNDSFFVWFEGLNRKEAVRHTEDLMEAMMQIDAMVQSQSLGVSVSSGLSCRDARHLSDLNQLMRQAAVAAHMSRQDGAGGCVVYDPNDQELRSAQEAMKLAANIDDILESDQVVLRCQRIQSLAEVSALPSYEILIAFKDKNGVLESPVPYIQAAERYNRMQNVDRMVVERVLKWMHQNEAALNQIEHISINLSGQSVGDPAVIGFIFDALKRYPVKHEKLCFEVTETAAIGSIDDAVDFINELRGLGIRFSLDDFGSGLSSYMYLKRLPVDYIKIDGMFVRDIVNDKSSLAMVKSMVDMGKLLGKKVVAEYVETEAHRQALVDMGADFAQGYCVHKPMPLDELTALMA